ncbi:MAG TPA: hypothetical protein PLI90_11035 [Rhodocyclaceae bacterium]|nr:hypothetical protein [Rhodocyclaceae bacterium]
MSDSHPWHYENIRSDPNVVPDYDRIPDPSLLLPWTVRIVKAMTY